MYSKIMDPVSLKKHNIYSRSGMRILKKYMHRGGAKRLDTHYWGINIAFNYPKGWIYRYGDGEEKMQEQVKIMEEEKMKILGHGNATNWDGISKYFQSTSVA